MADQMLLADLLSLTALAPEAEDYERVAEGLRTFLAGLLRAGSAVADCAQLDLMIDAIDRRLSAQIDEVLHHPKFQQLESLWRGVWFMVERADFRENIKISVLNCSMEDLLMDFEDSPRISKSGLYKLVYSSCFGSFGGRPFGAIVADYSFEARLPDIALLRDCAAVASMIGSPLFAAAAPSLGGQPDAATLAQKGGAALRPDVAKAWQAFRELGDARFVGLAFPRFLARAPYAGTNASGWRYDERVVNMTEHSWLNGAIAVGANVARSFARLRHGARILGPEDGRVADLPTWSGPAGTWPVPGGVEARVSEQRHDELAALGLIPLCLAEDTGYAWFRSATSCLAASGDFPADLNDLDRRMHQRLDCLLFVGRFAQYCKILHREQIGSWKERADIELELNKYLWQYVADADVVSSAVRSRRPLRKVRLSVRDVPGHAGWFQYDLRVKWHDKVEGAFTQLVLIGKLDKE